LVSCLFGDGDETGRLVVCGDSDLFHNLTLQSPENPNREFALNLIDWLSNDSDLITLRSRGRRHRPLHDFAAAYIDSHGGFTDDENENRQLSKDAVAKAHRQQRLISAANIFMPMLLMLGAGARHFIARKRKARLVK
jgi:ABC-type uncharacterized transport system involved in gliding motility auxiliary subunit